MRRGGESGICCRPVATTGMRDCGGTGGGARAGDTKPRGSETAVGGGGEVILAD